MLAGHALLLPVELQAVNRPASTNRSGFYGLGFQHPYAPGLRNGTCDRPPTMADRPLPPCAMANNNLIDQIAERVEHLLLRHEELQRTNALLSQQVLALTQERDQLKSRLSAARARVDALIDRLPAASSSESSS